MVSGDQDLSAVLLGLRRHGPAHSHDSPACPDQGPGGWARTRTPQPRTDAPPTANHRSAWKEVNPMRRPSLEELQRQVEEDGGCEATDGCFVEPDSTCDHGQPSWLLALGLI
jgi:hypothetical protein